MYSVCIYLCFFALIFYRNLIECACAWCVYEQPSEPVKIKYQLINCILSENCLIFGNETKQVSLFVDTFYMFHFGVWRWISRFVWLCLFSFFSCLSSLDAVACCCRCCCFLSFFLSFFGRYCFSVLHHFVPTRLFVCMNEGSSIDRKRCFFGGREKLISFSLTLHSLFSFLFRLVPSFFSLLCFSAIHRRPYAAG